ncbi:carbon monoxide dehydrogenase subunit G [Aureimonas fodinaquatilis]|uniref:Carbon monoxide dehydrogenase subunit G n=1 Tax=Aureimonas fodinaquatilis TaxID=2565783 RepID=A0A5B0DTM8_9HYPH|nr:carbon monoxide dehydrogenase subunit G [Aureimonas fodinaquatilis]KAA0968549.1 carbon monoxide dehydrogenase subunit G [Aureimonas fodinaquatilis]
MYLEDSLHLPLPRQTVWEGLNNPTVLKACIHGCETLEWQSADQLRVTVAIKLAIARVRFNGTITLQDVVAGESYTLQAQGSGITGFATGYAKVKLLDEGAGTRLEFQAGAKAGGALEKLGHEWIEKAGKKLVSRFFERFCEQVTLHLIQPGS